MLKMIDLNKYEYVFALSSLVACQPNKKRKEKKKNLLKHLQIDYWGKDLQGTYIRQKENFVNVAYFYLNLEYSFKLENIKVKQKLPHDHKK